MSEEKQPPIPASRLRAGDGPDSAPTAGWPLPALESLIYEATALFHRAHAVAEQIHGQGRFTAGKRGVLRGLDLSGPQTVPQMARIRPVSRQYIQMLVNGLADEGHVEFNPNPAHKRSRLVRLTPQGKAFLEAMYRREAKLLAGIEIDIAEEDLHAAGAILRTVREVFESDQWKQKLKAENTGLEAASTEANPIQGGRT